MRGRIAVVTGGARGIGEAIARALAKMGADIVIWDVLEDQAKTTAEAIAGEFGVRAAGMAVDVTRTEPVEEAAAAAAKDMGGIDILVNNAGITRDGLLIRMKEEDWDRVLAINLKGVWQCTRAVGRIMLKARRGAIVNIASVVGVMGNAGQANYSASKAGVIGLTKTSAKEFASRGVRVNAVAPGYIRTAMTDKLTDEQRKRMQDLIPLGELGTPDDVADAVAFLASDASRYITGQTLNICGGMVM
ncbi:MAG: 3-oxoacyl-[acyl-carrier-protein] reductase [Planctomycetota bacterium]|jgi:3-oxoacyl-[acyl-carrier protein] reductase|nr:3-oxoacyl-[acyl-carrier-protein] reductase [Planctomycetota bacterium]